MPRHNIFDDVETRDWTAYREASERLERYRIGDFSPLDDAVSETFSRSKGLNLTPPEIVSSACRDVARLYDQPPAREFSGAPQAVLEALYERSAINEALAEIDQKAHAQNLVVVAVDPAGPGRVKVHSFCPYEVAAPVFADLLETDIREALRVEIRVPVGADEGSTIFGRRVYTPDEAWVEGPGGKRIRGIFKDDFSNPYGFIPLVARREAPPASRGEWFPPIRESLLQLQEQAALAVADILRVCRHQCFVRKILTGTVMGSPVKLQAGPDAIWHFRGADDAPAPSYEEHHGAPPTKQYWESVEKMLSYYERFAGLTPGALSQSTGITGAAKAYEMEASGRRVRERMQRAARFEQDFLELVAAVAPTLSLAGRSPSLRVDFHLIKTEGNDLQAEQAFAVRCQSGVDSPVLRVMRTEGVSRAEAKKRVETRTMEADTYGGQLSSSVPGLDKSVR